MKQIIFFISVLLIFMYSDSYSQWINCNGPYGGSIFALEDNSELVIVGTYNGVFVSTNNGTTWTQRNFGIPQVPITTLLVKGNTIFAGTEVLSGVGGIYKSTDNAISWEPANNGLALANIFKIFSIVSSDTSLYASAYGKGLYKSQDNGQTWFEINNGITSTAVRSLTASDGYIFCGTEGGIYRSSNGGFNWLKLSNGLPTGSIFSIYSIQEFVYATFFSNVIFRSSNYGLFWIDITNNLPFAIIPPYSFIGSNKYNVFAGTYGNGIQYTSNFGSNWISRSEGLPDSTTVTCFTIKDTMMYAGTIYGVFKRPTGQIISIRHTGTVITDKFVLKQNYPNPFNPSTNIDFQIPKKSFVEITVFNISGKKIQTIVKEILEAGKYSANFNAGELPSGVYFYRIQAGDFRESKSMVLIK